jgi:RND family efflux transporter MFP subunit
MMMNRRVHGPLFRIAVIVRIVVIAGIAVFGVGCDRSGTSSREEAAGQARVAVEARPVVMRSIRRTVEGVGSLRSAREAQIAGKVMGSITEIRKGAGDAVRRGEVLIVVDSRDVAGQIAQASGAVAQARAAAALAETNFHRFQELSGRGSASPLEFDQARYQYETAKGAVAQAEGALATAESYRAYAEIPAPFDGRIVDRLCEVGELASPGRPLMKIEDPRRMRLHVTLPEGEAAAAIVGSAVEIEIPALGGRKVTGTVAEVVPASDEATHSVLVKIDLTDEADLRSGLYAKASFMSGMRPALRVPKSAVLERGGMTGIFVAESDRAAFRLVETGSASGDSIEIVAGIHDGERILVAPPAGLEEGNPIEVRS